MQEFLTGYISLIKQCLDDLPFILIEQAVDLLEKTVREERQIFAFGNGACAAAASHLVCTNLA